MAKSPQEIQAALLKFNAGSGLKEFSKHAKSKALREKEREADPFTRKITSGGTKVHRGWKAALRANTGGRGHQYKAFKDALSK